MWPEHSQLNQMHQTSWTLRVQVYTVNSMVCECKLWVAITCLVYALWLCDREEEDDRTWPASKAAHVEFVLTNELTMHNSALWRTLRLRTQVWTAHCVYKTSRHTSMLCYGACTRCALTLNGCCSLSNVQWGCKVTQPPPRHGKAFREAVDCHGALIHAGDGCKAVVLSGMVYDVLVDFV